MKFGRFGAPHPRTVWVTPDCTLLQWRKVGTKPAPMGKDAMSVSDIIAVSDGPVTPVFKRQARAVQRPACCFSVSTGGAKARTLDLECSSLEQKEKWMTAFLALQKYGGEL